MAVLLTGGSGYIGSHTAIALLDAGVEVIIADNFSNSNKSVLDRIAAISGKYPLYQRIDMRDAVAVERLFSENSVTGVVHLAGYKSVNESVRKPLPYYQNNLDTTMTLLEAMIRHHCKYLVFSSSAAVYGENNSSPMTEDMIVGSCSNPYAYSKLMNEQILTDISNAVSDMSVVILRYFNPVGAHPSGMIGELPVGLPSNLMPYITEVAAGIHEELHVYGNDYPTPDGTCVRDYIHIMDLAEGHIAALRYAMDHQGTAVFNLGTGKGTSVLEMVDTFCRVNHVDVPYSISARRKGDVAVCYADASKAARFLNWHAKRTIEDMCRDSWRWEKAYRSGQCMAEKDV